jgi:hypothetical protein
MKTKIKEIIYPQLKEAKSFLFPRDVGAQKREETYRYMVRIVKNISASVSYALNVIQKWDKGYEPLFKDIIFEPVSVTASDEEVLLTSMLAMGEDTYMTYNRALGAKFENMFNDFQRKTLEGKRYVDNSGGDDGYILTDDGEKVLSTQLKNTLNELPKEIKKPSELLDVVRVADFLNFVEEANRVSNDLITFPKLLALSLLYTKWEYLFTLNREDERNITEYLNRLGIGDAGQFTQIPWADGGIDLIEKIFSISNENTPETIDIRIDHLSEAEEDNIKRIHICSFLFDVTANKGFKIGLDKKSVTHELQNKFNTFPKEYKVVKEERGWMIVDTTTQAANNYYILEEKGQQEEGRLRVYADRTEDLKVRRSGKKLKVYRRRGKKP